MPRPKKAPVKKSPIKRTRRAKIDPTHPDVAKVPEAWIDEQLRKECIQIAMNGGSAITTLVQDAEKIYAFLKRGVSLTFTDPNKIIPIPVPDYDYAPVEKEDVPEPSPRLSKFDAHTL